MDWLEQELKQALDRKQPSADFAERVAARAARDRSVHRGWFARPWLAAAATVTLVVGGAVEYREYRGRQAKEQVMLALRLTSGKLNRIQTMALRASRRAHEVQQ